MGNTRESCRSMLQKWEENYLDKKPIEMTEEISAVQGEILLKCAFGTTNIFLDYYTFWGKQNISLGDFVR